MSNDFMKWLMHSSSVHRTRYPSDYPHKGKSSRDADKDKKNGMQNMIQAHPRTSMQDIESKVSSHTLFTGGKFLWNDEPVYAPVYGGEDQHNSIQIFSADHAPFIKAAPHLLGRPATYEDLFWLSYTRYLQGAGLEKPTMKLNVCITERVSSPLFKFFVDLDLDFVRPHADMAEWKEFVKSVCKSVGTAMRQAYPSIDANKDAEGVLEFTVMTANGYRASNNLYKRGIHLVWPKLLVTKKKAEILVRLMDEWLTLDVPRDVAENTWKDALDLSVYNSGLRLIGCVKSQKCSVCYPIALRRFAGPLLDAGRIMHLDMCHPEYPSGHAFLGKESMYKIQHIARIDGALLSTKDFKARGESHILRDADGRVYHFTAKALTSIRAPYNAKETEGFVLPPHLQGPLRECEWRVEPEIDPETGLPPPSKKKRSTTPGRDRAGEKNGVVLRLTFAEIHSLTNVLRAFNPRYRQILVDGAYAFPLRPGDKDVMLPPLPGSLPQRSLYSRIWIKVKGEGAHECLIKPGTHRSNTIRFHLDPNGSIAQSCWSIKPSLNGKPCCKQTTKGRPGLMDKFPPDMMDVIVGIFTRKL